MNRYGSIRYLLSVSVAGLILGIGSALTAQAQEDITMKILQRSQGTLAYDDQGAGPLIVMLPGLGDLRQSYRHLTPLLVASGNRVVTLDLRGHGESSAAWPSYTTAAVADDILALIDTLDAGPATLVGNSFSAGAATWAATETPEKVAAVVMVGPFVRDYGKPSLVMRVSMGLMFNGPWRVRAWSWFHGTLFTDKPPADHADYRARLRANLSEPGRFDAVKAMIDRNDRAVEQRLAQLTVPVLVVMGRNDPDFDDPAAEAGWIAGQSNGRVAMIDAAGHYPQAEQPQATHDAILGFLRK